MKSYMLFNNNIPHYLCRYYLFSSKKSMNFCFVLSRLYSQLSTCYHHSFKTSNYKTLMRTLTYKNISCVKNALDEKNIKNFSLNSYDYIGFDLDNTLCEYNISSLIQMEYEVISSYLVENKGYDPSYLYKPLNPDALDFLQRGLILDMKKGNIIKLDENGVIIKASHGSSYLTDLNIKEVYGDMKTCEISNIVFSDLTSLWNEPLKSEFRLLLDYFDLPASLGFARAVDCKDAIGNKDYQSIGIDIISALVYMYSRDHFKTGESAFFRKVKENPQKYINKCSIKVIDWLKHMKKTKKLFLVTGSNIDNASFTASNCFGANWKDFFDVVICYARKPGFFELDRPFYNINGLNEGIEIENHSLKLGETYSQGNWKDLYSMFCNNSKCKPKCLFIGDNFVEDIYTPRKNMLCDTVLVSEELLAEGFYEGYHASADYIRSRKWGSIFAETDSTFTLWGSIVNKYAKFCVPSLNYLANC